jgi:myo-inositol-1(or 4)-monophosphatase
VSEAADIAAIAADLARAAGALQLERFNDVREIETKSSEIDLVTDVDRASEALIVEQIRSLRPDDGILSEESGNVRESRSGWRWVIDPLDGTTNYAHRFPHFAVSIGVEFEGRGQVGAIYDPVRDELFSGSRDSGVALNGEPMRVSDRPELGVSLLATGFSYDVHGAEVLENLDYFGRFLRRARGIRRAGSAALDLAYVACGRFDGMWEMHLAPWDVAAGLVLIETAGGQTSDFAGGTAPLSGARLVASNGQIHAALLAVLADDPAIAQSVDT